MNILVTGAKGFIGKHTCLRLKNLGHIVFEYDLDSKDEDLISYINEADFIIHLAGINRPLTNEEFYDGNANFTAKLVSFVQNSNKNTPIILSSSIQATLDNDYGKSKKMGEDFLLESGLPVYIFRLANVFGKWCRPNYNSACATFCYNIAHDLDVYVRDRDYIVHFNYIDDIVDTFVSIVESSDYKGSKDILYVNPTHDCSLGKLVDLLHYFKQEVESDRHLPIIHDEFEYKLFKTFLDYLKDDKYNYNFSSDFRGSFQELYKNEKYGQISENISFKGITKGGHYHTYKKEIFYVVIGKCNIYQQNINDENDVIDITCTNENPTLVDIKVNYSHEITNIGDEDSHTLMWISEIYSPDTHDTFRKEIIKK